ncbi:hypothetical protein FRC11_008278 [Ceratobasidium sp. 423]|nr:hypothetical protein FRC11_008278 [Ceratobasidium sp. 423]
MDLETRMHVFIPPALVITDQSSISKFMKLNPRKHHAQSLIDQHHENLRTIPLVQPRSRQANSVVNIGIIGAGLSGLYVALMLDYLQDPNFDYELLEANPDRIGGRIYTHRFSSDEHDYYDVGAMRFPQIPWMQSAFDLMNYLGITPESGLLAPFIASDRLDNNLLLFNNKGLSRKELNGFQHATLPNYDPFQTGIPELRDSPGNIIDGQVLEFKRRLLEDWDKGWTHLMKYDNWTARQHMLFGSGPLLTPNLVSYLEMVYGSNFTGVYDYALPEIVLDVMNFEHENPIEWFRIEGGADILVSRAATTLSHRVKCGKRATSISPVTCEGFTSPNAIELTVNGAEKSVYSHVISTLPFTCLSLVDTSRCNLGWFTETAFRSLRYMGSVKIAIKFTERWWERLPKKQLGGESTTDRPMHTVIYPSYGIGGKSAVLIVSYTWGQDAVRVGPMVHGDRVRQSFLNTILHDLAEMHDIRDPVIGNIDYDILPSLVVDHHAWDWGNSEFSIGGCAFFGPSQFTALYPYVTTPAFGLLHFAGEAASTHHSWVVGPLSSAFRSLCEIFIAEGRKDLIARLVSDESPFKNAGKYEIDMDTIEKQVAIGQTHRP